MLLLSLLLTSVTHASNTMPVASVTILNNNTGTTPTSGYLISLWRYPEGGGQPTAVAASSGSGQTVRLYDFGLQAFPHTNPGVHYSVLALQKLQNGSVIRLSNYHWGTFVVEGQVSKTEDLALKVVDNGIQIAVNGQAVPYQLAPSRPFSTQRDNMTSMPNSVAPSQMTSQNTWPMIILQPAGSMTSSPQASATSETGSSSVAPNSPGDCYSYPDGTIVCWNVVQTWNTVVTTIGEGTGSGYMSDVFSYGVSSGSQLDVVESANGGGWSIQGSWTIYNSQSAAATWPNLYCCWNYLANSYFNYEEDQLEVCNIWCTTYNQYQIWATGWDGGTEAWGTAGTSDSSPGDCLPQSTLQQSYSYAPYAPGSGFTYTTANGYRYSFSTTISANIVGTSYSATIGDSTSYDQHTTQQMSFGNQYSNYYVYTNAIYSGGVTQWPVLFTSNTAAHCGP